MSTLRRNVAAGALLLVSAALAFYGFAYRLWQLALECAPDYSESTILAPDSYRGRLLCTVADGELGISAWSVVILGLVPLLAVVTAVVVWVRRHRFAPMLAFCAMAALAPTTLWLASQALPADCTDAQWKAHGSNGCERNEEERPGLGQYDARAAADRGSSHS